MRTIVFWGPYWGPLILGNYHFGSWLGLFGLFPWVCGLGFRVPFNAHPCLQGMVYFKV